MKVILPKTYIPEVDITYPLFFLAGPVNGGNDWQCGATNSIQKKVNEFFVAIPHEYKEGHPLHIHRMVNRAPDFFKRQLPWERHYIKLAAGITYEMDIHVKCGCLIFWLPAESECQPRNDGLPYAMDTRREVGEALGWLRSDPSLRIVIGAEKNFPGIDTIQRCFTEELGKFIFHESLEETIGAGLQIALGQ